MKTLKDYLIVAILVLLTIHLVLLFFKPIRVHVKHFANSKENEILSKYGIESKF